MANGAFDWSGLLQSGVQLAATIYQGQLVKKQQRQTMRAQAAQLTDMPQLGMGLASTGPQRNPLFGFFDVPMGEVQPMAMSGVEGGGSSTAMSPYSSGYIPTRPIYTIANTPSGGQRVIGMRSMGTPLLWSGDFAAVKRVARVARKLGRFARTRRPR